ncbi:MAG: hypothetical protein K0S01_524 [Herbinix sp.]|jgi:hypothetical protein|nr:hypothetical protein [Herbinix sp.]
MNSCELITFVNTLACIIAKCTPKDDLPLLTAILGQLAASLATIAVNEDLLAGDKNVVPIAVPETEIIEAQPRL